MSSGRASESGCYEAADATYHYLTEILGAHPAQIVVAGWSLGAAVAIDLAARKQVAGLIVLGAFTNIPEQAHAMLPWVPRWVVRLFIRERFDNVSKFRQVTCPIFIGHGTGDELAPFAMAECLAQVARQRSPVTFLPIQGCSPGSLRRVEAVFGPRSRTFYRTCGKWTPTLMNAPEPSAGTMGECDDHATDQRGPSLQAYLCLTAGMQVGESTESVKGGKRDCMQRYLPLVAASSTPSIREAPYMVWSRRSRRF